MRDRIQSEKDEDMLVEFLTSSINDNWTVVPYNTSRLKEPNCVEPWKWPNAVRKEPPQNEKIWLGRLRVQISSPARIFIHGISVKIYPSFYNLYTISINVRNFCFISERCHMSLTNPKDPSRVLRSLKNSEPYVYKTGHRSMSSFRRMRWWRKFNFDSNRWRRRRRRRRQRWRRQWRQRRRPKCSFSLFPQIKTRFLNIFTETKKLQNFQETNEVVGKNGIRFGQLELLECRFKNGHLLRSRKEILWISYQLMEPLLGAAEIQNSKFWLQGGLGPKHQ